MGKASLLWVIVGAGICLYVFPNFKEFLDIVNGVLLGLFPDMSPLEQWYWSAAPLIFLGLIVVVVLLQFRNRGGEQ